MTTEELKQKLHSYIDLAADKKLEALYTVLESDITETAYDWQKDEEWLAELDRRQVEALDENVKKYSLEEAVTFARKAIQKEPVAK